MFLLKKEDLKTLLTHWASRLPLYTPQIEDGQVMLLPYEESTFTMEYINFAFPVKEYLFKQKEVFFHWKNKDGNINLEMPENPHRKNNIYFGVRPCDAYGIRYMDKFFLEGYRDGFYGRNREAAIIVALNCTEVGKQCFCSSMGTGPFAESGYDLLFTSLKDGYFIEVGSLKGEKLIDSSKNLFREIDESFLEEKETLKQNLLSEFKRKIHTKGIHELLEKNFEHSIWEKVAKDCISCTGCTSVCPTCTCYNVVDENINKNNGSRVRYWDSCQSRSFTRNAGGHNPRSATARVRYRIYDKFKYIEEKFGFKGCTGCGRCSDVCPAFIDVVEIINALAEDKSSKKNSGGEQTNAL